MARARMNPKQALAMLGGKRMAREELTRLLSYDICDGGIYEEVYILAMAGIDAVTNPPLLQVNEDKSITVVRCASCGVGENNGE